MNLRETMTENQTYLMELMSDLSEKHWCAGWLNGLEQGLWKDMNDVENLPSGFYNDGWFSKDDYVKDLKVILKAALDAGGWVVWNNKVGREMFVTFDELYGMYPDLPKLDHEICKLADDDRKDLLKSLTNDELVNVVTATSMCDKHLGSVTKGFGFSSCLRCQVEEMSGILSAIDYEIQKAEGFGNEIFDDLNCDPACVLEHVRSFIKKCANGS